MLFRSNELLARSDVLSIHAASPPSAGFLIGRKELSQMKSGSRLINSARGYMVDEEALLEALRAGRLSGAALDVYQEEPYTGPLCTLPRCCALRISALYAPHRERQWN